MNRRRKEDKCLRYISQSKKEVAVVKPYHLTYFLEAIKPIKPIHTHAMALEQINKRKGS